MRNKSFLAAALTAALGIASAQTSGQWRTAPNGTSGTSQQNNQPPNGPGDSDDHRDAGVARVSVADGDVELVRGDSRDRLPARGGMALAGNDSISTGRSSRAEVQLGPGNLVRLSEESQLRIVDVGNRYFRVEVLRGTVNVSQLRGGEADIDVMAPNTTVRPLKTGVYRITVRDGGQTDLTVRKGEAEIVSSRGGEKVKSGRRASVRGDRQNPELLVSNAEHKDSFDRWNERRDDVLEPNFRGGGGSLYGGYGGGYGYPFWGPGLGFGYQGFGYGYQGFGGGLGYRGIGFGGFYRPTVVIGRVGGFRGGRRR